MAYQGRTREEFSSFILNQVDNEMDRLELAAYNALSEFPSDSNEYKKAKYIYLALLATKECDLSTFATALDYTMNNPIQL